MLTMCDIVWSSFAHIKELLSFPIWLLSLIVAVFIAGPAVDPALCTDQVSCDHQLDHKKQDHQHHPHHLQVLGNHHCTLVHPCKTEHLENYAGFPFLIRMSQFERKKKQFWTSHLSAWLARNATMGGQPSVASSSTRKTFGIGLKCLQATHDMMVFLLSLWKTFSIGMSRVMLSCSNITERSLLEKNCNELKVKSTAGWNWW